MSKPVVEIRNLSKTYEKKSSTFRDFVGNMRKRTSTKKIEVLRDIDLDVYPGEALGIIGRNGAGKSTLLKLISGITSPTSGYIKTTGSVGSLLEVGTGFHPELTGKENIYLNGSILGMSKNYINSRYDEIVEFSGVSDFIDSPLKNYSSGMYMRLAFSVAAFIETDILIVDEVLSVGDLAFRRKSMQKMKELVDSGRTLLFVSHNMDQVKSICNRAIWLDNHKIKRDDNSAEVVKAYTNSIETKIDSSFKEPSPKDPGLTEAITVSKDKIPRSLFRRGETIGWIVKTQSSSVIKDSQIRISIESSNGTGIVAMRSGDVGQYFDLNGEQSFFIELTDIIFNPGNYDVKISLELSTDHWISELTKKVQFKVVEEGIWDQKFDHNGYEGLIQSRGRWKEL